MKSTFSSQPHGLPSIDPATSTASAADVSADQNPPNASSPTSSTLMTAPENMSTAQLKLYQQQRAQQGIDFLKALNRVRHVDTHSWCPLSYRINDDSTRFLPSAKELLGPYRFDELRTCFTTLPPKNRKHRPNDKTKTKIETKTTELIEKVEDIESAVEETVEKIKKACRQYEKPKLDAAAKERLAKESYEAKLNALTSLTQKSNELIDSILASASDFPRCQQRSDFISTSISLVDGILCLRVDLAALRLPGRQYPDESVPILKKEVKKGSISLEEMMEKNAANYASGAAEMWAQMKAERDLMWFRQTLTPHPSLEFDHEQQRQAAHDMFDDLAWLCDSSRLVFEHERSVPAEIGQIMKSASAGHALKTLQLADRSSQVHAPATGLDLPSRLMYTWRTLRSALNDQHEAVISMMEVKDLKKESREARELTERYLTREHALLIAERFADFEDGFELLEVEIMSRCEVLLKTQSNNNTAPYIDAANSHLFNLRYSRLIAQAYQCIVRAEAECLPPAKPSTIEQERPLESKIEEIPEGVAEDDGACARVGEPSASSITQDMEELQLPEALKHALKEARTALENADKTRAMQTQMNFPAWENAVVLNAKGEYADVLQKLQKVIPRLIASENVDNNELLALELAQAKRDRAHCKGWETQCDRYLKDVISRPPTGPVLRQLEARDGFGVQVVITPSTVKALEKRHLLICMIDFPPFGSGEYVIQRHRQPLHYHLPGIGSVEELKKLDRDGLLNAIDFVSIRPHGPAFNPSTGAWETRPRDIVEKEVGADYLYRALQAI